MNGIISSKTLTLECKLKNAKHLSENRKKEYEDSLKEIGKIEEQIETLQDLTEEEFDRVMILKDVFKEEPKPAPLYKQGWYDLNAPKPTILEGRVGGRCFFTTKNK